MQRGIFHTNKGIFRGCFDTNKGIVHTNKGIFRALDWLLMCLRAAEKG
jgi:hypothetical protein